MRKNIANGQDFIEGLTLLRPPTDEFRLALYAKNHTFNTTLGSSDSSSFRCYCSTKGAGPIGESMIRSPRQDGVKIHAVQCFS